MSIPMVFDLSEIMASVVANLVADFLHIVRELIYFISDAYTLENWTS